MRKLIIFYFIIFSNFSFGQGNVILYKDNEVKVSFKKFNDTLGYLLEDYDGLFGGILVNYHIDDDTFVLNELDTILIVDTMIFIENQNYTDDSVMLSLKTRINEFSQSSISFDHLTFIINDSLRYEGTKMYKKDEFHRALIPQFEVPYKLEVELNDNKLGPFIIESKNDIKVKILVLMPILTFEFDYGKKLPSKISYDGKSYKLTHNFIPWD